MATDKPMQLGMIGLGRMGANLVRRLMRDGSSPAIFLVLPVGPRSPAQVTARRLACRWDRRICMAPTD